MYSISLWKWLYLTYNLIESLKYGWWMIRWVLDHANGASSGLQSPAVVALQRVCIYILRCNTYMLCIYECVRDTLARTQRGGDRQWKKALHISWNAIWWVVKWDFASALRRWSHCWPGLLDLTLHLHVQICFLQGGIFSFIVSLHCGVHPLFPSLCSTLILNISCHFYLNHGLQRHSGQWRKSFRDVAGLPWSWNFSLTFFCHANNCNEWFNCLFLLILCHCKARNMVSCFFYSGHWNLVFRLTV